MGPMGLVLLGVILFVGGHATAQDPEAVGTNNAGQFFTISGRIESETIDNLQTKITPYLQEMSASGVRPVLVFVIESRDSRFGAASDLATFISRELLAARTVAFVPGPLQGFDVLPALACDELLMAPQANIGPIAEQGRQDYDATSAQREFVRVIARTKGRDAELLLGMLEPARDLRRISTVQTENAYAFADAMPPQVLTNAPAWEGSVRGRLTAEQARGILAKRLVDSRQEVALLYNLPTQAINESILVEDLKPVRIAIHDVIDRSTQLYLEREIQKARSDGINLILLDLNSPGGEINAAQNAAERIAELDGESIRTVAYINYRALGVSALLALACDEIVLARDGEVGLVDSVFNRGQSEPLGEDFVASIAEKAAQLAEQNGHPPAVARAMVDPATELYRAKDTQSGAVKMILKSEAEAPANQGRYELPARPIKEAGRRLRVTAEDAESLGLARSVVDDEDALKSLYGLEGQEIPVNAPTWIDSVVTTLNTPWVSWLLLFFGIFLLILEFKLPGIGLPAIGSALCFLLFFWSRYLSGTADQLEILLFILGLICVAVEIFILPGFGVFGASGVLLVLLSVVMASHTFIWPSTTAEYNQMGRTLLQLFGTLVLVAVAVYVLSRYLPSIPLFNRLILMPEVSTPELEGKPSEGGPIPLAFLLGETGKTTTVCKPIGKARFGEHLVEVRTERNYLDSGQLVEVVEVQGSRAIVRPVEIDLSDA